MSAELVVVIVFASIVGIGIIIANSLKDHEACKPDTERAGVSPAPGQEPVSSFSGSESPAGLPRTGGQAADGAGVAVLPQAAASAPRRHSWQAFIDAIAQVESGGNDKAIGKKGERGRYQIGLQYWIDAGGDSQTWESHAHNASWGIWIMTGYLCRYCPDAFEQSDWETCARIHNGGPMGASTKRRLTDKYWAKVKAELEKGN